MLAVSQNSCVDIKNNLSKGKESDEVKDLQNFLTNKGYLKTTPNGYFGPATLIAVKLYQKSLGFNQSGQVLTLTRAAIKKETCSTNEIKNTNTNNQTIFCTMDAKQCPDGSYVGRTGPKCEFICPKNINQATTTQATTTPTKLPVSIPTPVINFIDKRVFLAGGKQGGFTLTGFNFSTSSANVIYVTNRGSGIKYVIGSFTSTNGGTIIHASTSLTSSTGSCLTNCSDILPAGEYDMSVTSSGRDSNTIYFVIKSFNVSAVSGSASNNIMANSNGNKLGLLTLGGNTTLKLDSISMNIRSDTLNLGNFRNYVLKDEMTGGVLGNLTPGADFVPTATTTLQELQSKIIGVYADIKSSISGYIYLKFNITVEDFISGNKSTFTTPETTVTVTGVL